MIDIRTMDPAELRRIGEVDRTERVTEAYVSEGETLRVERVAWDVPPWSAGGDGPHTVPGKIAAWRPWLEHGGTLFGAFDAGALVGFALYRPRLSPGVAQFAVLHVSRAYRRRGIGAALARRVIEAARRDAAQTLYVSAAPTKGTVDFYRSLGFRPTQDADPVLYALEPEDIHMTLALGAGAHGSPSP